jgi:predicted ABC-type ATPase
VQWSVLSQTQHKCLYVIAGSNGAGKTTFARTFLPEFAHCPNFINPDLIAAGLSPFDPQAAMVAAGRLVIHRMGLLIDAGSSFGFETTLSGRMHVRFLQRARERHYRVHLFYLWIPSPDLGLARIRDRVEGGGHRVPEKDVRRRYTRTWRNLLTLYRPLADTLHCFDNSGVEPDLVFRETGGRRIVYDQVRMQQMMESGSCECEG